MQSLLIVDDDRDLLLALSDGLLGAFEPFLRIETCPDPLEAVARLRTIPELAVVVADMRMPGMSGLEFLRMARAIVPSAARVMLTSADDAGTAISAINEGNVCRFLTKPCAITALETAIREALELGQTVQQLVENQLRMAAGAVEVLAKIIQMVKPECHALAQRLRQRVRELALETRHPDFWELEAAAMLAPLGALGSFPPHLRDRPVEAFSGDFPQAAAALLRQIPQLERIAFSLAYLGKNFDGSGRPNDDLAGVEIPLGSRMLRVVRDLEEHLSGGASAEEALQRMRGTGGVYDPSMLAAAQACFGGEPGLRVRNATAVEISALREGDTLAEDIPAVAGTLLLSKGCRVTPNLKDILQEMARGGSAPEKVRIRRGRVHR